MIWCVLERTKTEAEEWFSYVIHEWQIHVFRGHPSI